MTPDGDAQQPAPQPLHVLRDVNGKLSAAQFDDAPALRQRLAPPAPHADATHIAELTAALAAANHALCSVTDAAEQHARAARTEVARAQASLAAALDANAANLEVTLALKREAQARVDRVIADAEEKLRLHAVLARERERMLLLEAGRLQQVAAQWETRARSLEARMASTAAAAAGAASPVGAVPSPEAQAKPGTGQLRVLQQPSAAAQAGDDGAHMGVGQESQQQQPLGGTGLMGAMSPSGIIRLGLAGSAGGSRVGSAVPPPTAASPPPQGATATATAAAAPVKVTAAAAEHGASAAHAGSAPAHGGPGPGARQSAAQQFGLPADLSSLDMLAAIAAALLPVHVPRPGPKPRSNPLAPVHAPLKHVARGDTAAAPKRAPGRPRKHPLPPGTGGAPGPIAGVPGAETVAAAGAGPSGGRQGTARQGEVQPVATAPKRSRGRPRKHPLPASTGGAPEPISGMSGAKTAAATGPAPSGARDGEAQAKRGRGRPPKVAQLQETPPAAAAIAAAAPGLIAAMPGSRGGAAARAGAAGGSGQEQQEPDPKRPRLHDDEMDATARLVATERTDGPRQRWSTERTPVLPAVAAVAAAAGGQGQPVPVPALEPEGARAVQAPAGPGCGGNDDQEPPCITISSSSSDEAGSSGAVAAGEVDGPQDVNGTPVPRTSALQEPCGQAGSATSDGGRSCSGGGVGGNSTDTTPFSPSQVMAEVDSADAGRKGARAEARGGVGAGDTPPATAPATAAAAVRQGHTGNPRADAAEEQADPRDAGAAGHGTGPCCGAAACGSPCTAAAAAAPAAGPSPRPATGAGANAASHTHAAPAPAPAAPAAPTAACRKPAMGLGAAEAVMRRLYLGVLAAARAVPGAAAAFETCAALEQLPGYGRCVASQDMMFFARIDARIGGRRAGFSRSSPLRYASPDALRADFARIMDNCHVYSSRAGAGGGLPGKSSKALLELAVAVLEAVDAALEAVRGSAELAEALAAVEAMEHKLECRECGKWRRLRGYGRFVRMRCKFSCGSLPGRTCGEPCDVCGAADDCECDDLF